jgi:hypothetical protein
MFFYIHPPMNPFFCALLLQYQLFLTIIFSCPFISYIPYTLIYLFLQCYVIGLQWSLPSRSLNDLTNMQPPSLKSIWNIFSSFIDHVCMLLVLLM